MEVITGSATTIITVTGILIAITLMFMIAGMHLLGPAGTLPNYPTDFATVPYAMRTVLQVRHQSL